MTKAVRMISADCIKLQRQPAGDIMNEKRITALLGVCLTAVFCLALYLASGLGDESESDTIVVIEDRSQPITELTAMTEHQVPENKNKQTITQTETSVPQETEYLWININTASEEEFQKLEGIGPAIAAEIISYRTENGDFMNIDQLLEVDGIGEKKFEAIRDHIYVENPAYYSEQEDTSDISPEIIEPETQPEDTEAAEEIVPVNGGEIVTEAETTTELTLEAAAPININTADAEELMLLPHVTEEIAERIISLREEIGGYSHVYELLYIEELEQKQVAEMVEFVTVGQ